jgi:hypothetical protein
MTAWKYRIDGPKKPCRVTALVEKSFIDNCVHPEKLSDTATAFRMNHPQELSWRENQWMCIRTKIHIGSVHK